MKLRFFRDKNNHYYYYTYIKSQKCNIYLETNYALNHTIFKDCYWIIKNLNIDITDLERKLIHNNMFNNGNDFDYYY